MIWFYVLSLLPILIGGILWVINHKVNLIEWLIGSVCAFILSGFFHLISISGMTDDKYILSGQIVSERQFSRWQEWYEEAIYKYVTKYRTVSYTDSKGRHRTRRESYQDRVFSHWSPRTRWHNEYWTAYSDINTNYSIDKVHFQKLEKEFKHTEQVKGDRETLEHNSKMIGGDSYDYISTNISNNPRYTEPVVEISSFENRIKAAPTVFSFVKVPPNIPVYNYPYPNNPWVSDRVLGISKQVIDRKKWDELNAILGPKHNINLIIIGFDSLDSSLLEFQEAKFIGGKKNDLIIAYTSGNNKVNNVKVFGWTESNICKQNINSYIIQNGVNEQLIEFLKEEISNNYKVKDWSKFDYISLEPDSKYFYWFFGFLILTQGGLYFYFHNNEFVKQ